MGSGFKEVSECADTLSIDHLEFMFGERMRKNLPVTQKEYEFRDDQRLITTTNLKGVITYCNDDFAEVSGYACDELLGQAHNLIRHPDVPPAVFAHMWGYLEQGRNWMGVVKNRRKNGDHYWVNAYVTPIRDGDEILGYESVRIKATADEISRSSQLYERLNSNDKSAAFDWRRLLISLTPGTLCGTIGGVFVYTLGLAGLIPALLLSAPFGLYMQHRRDNALAKLFKGSDNGIDSPLLMHMYTQRGGSLGRMQMTLFSHEARLRTCLSRVGDFTEQLKTQALHSRELSRQSSEQLERQRAETDMVAAAINQMSATSQDVAHNVSKTAEATLLANQQAEKGKQVVSQAREVIELLSASVGSAATAAGQLADDAQEIGSVVDVITGIADQTNLLALNAAIEAARAGEQGRGFAVVADEVRALAKRTADATEQIHQLIESLQQATSHTVTTMNAGMAQADKGVIHVIEADTTLENIREAIGQVSTMGEQIASAAEEQSAVAEEINRNISNIAALSDQTATQSRQNARLSEELAETASSQSTLVARFTQG